MKGFLVIPVCGCISYSADASVSSDIWLCTPTSPRRLTNLNLGKGRCIGWQRSVKMGGSKAHLWEQLPPVSSRETTWPLCPGQWGAAGALEDALRSSVNDPAPSGNHLCPSINQILPILPPHRRSGSSLNTLAAIYSIIFDAAYVSREIKPADQAEYKGRELKLWHLLRRVIVGALFVPLGTKACLKKKNILKAQNLSMHFFLVR